MIIPPDPEKDPNIFTASTSTPSLFPPPTEPSASTSDISLSRPVSQLRSNRNRAYGYPFSDDLGIGFTGEALPPYERRRRSGDTEGDIVADPPSERPSRSASVPAVGVALDGSPSSAGSTTLVATSSTSRLPIPVTPYQAPLHASTSKLWESSTSVSTDKSSRSCWGLSPRNKKRWRKYRRWLWGSLVLLCIALGVTVGLLVGRRQAVKPKQPDPRPWGEMGSPDGKKSTSWANNGESLNFTYSDIRDGPRPQTGNLTQCNLFTPLNTSSPSPFQSLSIPNPSSRLYTQTFTFPLNTSSTPSVLSEELLFFASGLGSSGTLEFVGNDPGSEVAVGDGEDGEGVVRVDVVVMYAGGQGLDGIMRVCEMVRDDGARGVGIYTPVETDGKVTNPYMLNPLLIPSFHIIVRFPPSAYNQPTTSIYIPKITMSVERMAVRFGNMQNVVEFGDWSVQSGRGGVVAGYVAAESVMISTGENAVRGRWNVSKEIVVNNTDAAILAEVILFDPSSNATNIPDLTSPDLFLVSRNADNDTTHNSTNITSADFPTPPIPPQPIIKTLFTTDQGLVSIAYLNQPSTITLQSYITTAAGDIDISMHPDYTGPFLIKNTWGQVRLPPPNNPDVVKQGRKRMVETGTMDLSGGMFLGLGMNQTTLNQLCNVITGVAYWEAAGVEFGAGLGVGLGLGVVTGNGTGVVNGSGSGSGNTTQAGAAARVKAGEGAELVVLGAWGDVVVTFDGT